MKRPESSDYPRYYQYFIEKVEGDSIEEILQNQLAELETVLGELSEEQGDYKYAEEKWTVKEVLHHIIDVERIMAYRALRISRGDNTPLVGFEQDDYVRDGFVSSLTLKSLLEEFKAVRLSTIAQYKNTNELSLDYIGIASDNQISTLALFFIIAGHELHHFEVLKEKYLMKE